MRSEDVRIEVVTTRTAVVEAGRLFDDPPIESSVDAFLADERHHLLIAYVGDEPAGFVSGVELFHPDKPKPEMFLYELGVDEAFRGQGVATALVRRLVDLGRERGCGTMFTLADEDNEAARATYGKAGGETEPAGNMFVWTFGEDV